MKTITIEEHFMSPGYADGPGRNVIEYGRRAGDHMRYIYEQLLDVGEKRIAAMDEAGIDVQVLSIITPGTEQLEAAEAIRIARETNDFVADAVTKYPNRFAGFAALPTAAPDKAVTELELRVQKYGFKGAVINGHIKSQYLDDKFFWPILECAEKLDVPIVLHPAPPPKPIIDTYYGGFAPEVTDTLATMGWGWHIDTAVHVIRMIVGGVFDKYPKLQVLIGHLGEGLPFMLERMDWALPPKMTGLKRQISDYLRQNISYSFSGFNYTATFLDLLLEVGVDRIMFSVDYPYGSMAKARAFLEQLPVSTADREKIAHGNAERLLKL